jgi:hypothetical protein
VAPSNAQAIALQWRDVHGLDRTPTFSENKGRLTRQVWCNDLGEATVEVNIIAGMGHGTPLGDDGLGTPGPFMLDVGTSSTRDIARFWGMVERDSISTRSQSTVIETPQAKSPEATAAPRHERATASSAPGVKKIIEDALRAAGLMR